MEIAEWIYHIKTVYKGGIVRKNWMRVAPWIVLVCVSSLPLLDLLHPGLPVTHDGQDHVARIANFYASLMEGNSIPRWAANLNWGYGHPILMFLYPLPSYVASLFHAVGFSFVDSTKLVFAAAFIASTLSMYVWASTAWGVVAGMTAAILYTFAPYRFVDLYVRGAIGEHMAFVFPPLICYGLLLLVRERKQSSPYVLVVVSVGTALLIMAHNALSLMFLPLIVLYAVYLAYQDSKKPIHFLSLFSACVLMGFLLSAFYWAPGFFEGKYTLRDIVISGGFTDRFVPWLSFLYSPWSYGGSNDLSKWLGAGQLLTVAIGLFTLRKQTKYRQVIAIAIALLGLSLFLMTGNSVLIWNTVTLIQKFQFPWRILSVAVFLIAVIGGLVAHLIPKNSRRKVAALICLVSIVTTMPMWRAKEYKMYRESFFTGVYNGTTDTGESSPIWSIRFMEKRPIVPAYLMPDYGIITLGRRTTTLREYAVTVKTPTRFIENTLYFPGWLVYINGVLLSTDKLLFQDPMYRGLMTFDLAPGKYDIRFVFSETKLRTIANYVSIASLAVFCVGLGTMYVLWQKKR